MTKAYLKYSNGQLELSLKGHADRSQGETDNLCCAGISMLGQAACEWAYHLAESEHGGYFDVKNESGELHMIAIAYPEYKQEASAIYDYLYGGLSLLMRRYPGKLTWGEI